MHHHHHHISTPENTVALQALVAPVVNAINLNQIIPLGDYGGDSVYVFDTMKNGLGSIIYTQFDKHTNIGLASWMVRYGAATTIYQVLFGQMPKSSIDLKHLILPRMPHADHCSPPPFIPPVDAGPDRGRRLRNTTIPQ